ncbi:MAG: ABC transporter substrate-binding protein [bacterium]|nr:ABC transporter substrate-binding protein [bacterium]
MTGRMLLAALLLALAATAQAPYSSFRNEGADFLGPASVSAGLDTVRIGVVLPGTGVAARALRLGVELAITDVNLRHPAPKLVAILRGDDGPWSSAAAAAVHLVREAGAMALLAGPDGGRAHACELVAAKLWVPVLAPVAADHTIDYANVPWMFRLGPDDRQQLSVLLDHAHTQGWNRLAWIGADERDSHIAEATARRLAAAMGDMGVTDDPQAADAMLVWGSVDAAPELLAAAGRLAPGRPLLGPWMLAAGSGPSANQALHICVPAGEGGMPPIGFRRRLPPGMSPAAEWMAALTYDAVELLAQALAGGATTPTQLRGAVATADGQGLSGTIRFDTLGGRRAPALVVRRESDLAGRMP